jgi:hypothetical protein
MPALAPLLSPEGEESGVGFIVTEAAGVGVSVGVIDCDNEDGVGMIDDVDEVVVQVLLNLPGSFPASASIRC